MRDEAPAGREFEELKLMEYFFASYWWLLFPIGFFIFGAWDRWLAYRRSRDHLELLKQYAAAGKDPPPELVRGVQADAMNDPAGAGFGADPPPSYAHPFYW